MGEKPFEDLDGLFDEVETTSPLTRKYNMLAKLLEGSGYLAAEIVAIAIGSTHAYQGNRMSVVFLTNRGIEESQHPDLAELYQGLTSQTDIVQSISEMPEEVGDMLRKASTNEITYKNLGGPKLSLPRILMLYVTDQTNTTYEA